MTALLFSTSSFSFARLSMILTIKYADIQPKLVIPNIINRSWFDRLCKEGTPCPQAPGDVAAELWIE